MLFCYFIPGSRSSFIFAHAAAFSHRSALAYRVDEIKTHKQYQHSAIWREFRFQLFFFSSHTVFFYKLSSYAVGAHCFVVCFMATKNRRNIKSNKKVIFCFRTFLFACTWYELTTQEKQVMESISCPINHVFRSRHPHPKHIKKLGLT